MTGWADTCGQGTSSTAHRESHPPRSLNQSHHPKGHVRHWDKKGKIEKVRKIHIKFISTWREGNRFCLVSRTQGTRLPAVYQPALMVKGGWSNFSFYHSDAWCTANVGTQKVATEHITEGDNKDKSVETRIFNFQRSFPDLPSPWMLNNSFNF